MHSLTKTPKDYSKMFYSWVSKLILLPLDIKQSFTSILEKPRKKIVGLQNNKL